MPLLTPSDVRVDPVLTNVAIDYVNPSWVSHQVFPHLSVDKEGGKVYVWDRGDFYRDTARKRAPGTPAAHYDSGLSTTTYASFEMAQRTLVADRLAKDADMDLKMATARHVRDKVELGLDKEWAAAFFASGKWTQGTTLSGTDQWSDFSGSDPINDIITGADTIADAIGRPPNVAVISRAVRRQLVQHPRFTAATENAKESVADLAHIAKSTGIPRWIVAETVQTTSNEAVTDVTAAVFGKHCLLLYVAAAPSLVEPSSGYTFVSSELQVKQYRDEALAGDWYEGSTVLGFHQTMDAGGYLIVNAVA